MIGIIAAVSQTHVPVSVKRKTIRAENDMITVGIEIDFVVCVVEIDVI